MISLPPSLLAASRTRPIPQLSSPALRIPRHTLIAGLQRRHAGGEPTRISEDEHVDSARRTKGEGSIMATQSGLFKLLLPLPGLSNASTAKRLSPAEDSSVMFLLHPRQPLSIIASLISTEVSPKSGKPVDVTFHGADQSTREAKDMGPTTPTWSQASELGDFIQEAAKDSKFIVVLHEEGQDKQVTAVRVPTFKERTQFLRNRLQTVTKEMQSLLDVKTECDELALQGAKRAAVAGFGGLAAYWGVVYYLTFYLYGWDVMEPVTYLTGLTGIMAGYLWFLYHQKEISYRSVFEMSSSKRREQLYDVKGFDRQRWKDLVDEGTELRRAIKKIAQDYSTDWSMDREIADDKAVEEIKKHAQKKHGGGAGKNSKEEDKDETDQDRTTPH